MDVVTLLGLIAATLTTGSFAPQALKVIKSKETKDISLAMFSMITFGMLLWLIYGILVQDLPIVVANAISVVLGAIVLGYKLKYG